MSSHCRAALKEREELCLRLGDGRQILLLRKGGLREPRGGFRAERAEFLLFPTRFHEQGTPAPAVVEMTLFAELDEAVRVDDPGRLKGLEEAHGLSWAEVEKRFRYGTQPGLTALILRVWRLSRPVRVEDAGRYDGCRSWVELADEIALPAATPVLDGDAFRAKAAPIRKQLHG